MHISQQIIWSCKWIMSLYVFGNFCIQLTPIGNVIIGFNIQQRKRKQWKRDKINFCINKQVNLPTSSNLIQWYKNASRDSILCSANVESFNANKCGRLLNTNRCCIWKWWKNNFIQHYFRQTDRRWHQQYSRLNCFSLSLWLLFVCNSH